LHILLKYAKIHLDNKKIDVNTGGLLMDVTEIKKLMEILNTTDVTEITLEAEGTKVLLKKDQMAAAKSVKAPELEAKAPAAVEEKKEAALISMNVGKFYRKSKTGVDFVKIGDTIKEGQMVGYIESIGIRTDVKSDKNGIIKDILVENGGNAEFGQKLMILDIK